ncbi:MAG: hypothetical protein DWP97_13945, partial [Calditrichaeota bacterium]
MKKILTILILLLIFSFSASAEVDEENHIFKSFDVYPENNIAGSITSYQLHLKTWKWKLRKALTGKLEVKVPESFSLEMIHDIQVEFSDTSWNYRVSSFEIEGNKLWIYFASEKSCETCPGDGDGEPDNGDWSNWWHKYQIDINIYIDGIKNPAEIGTYTFFFTGYDRHDNKKISLVESKPFLIDENVSLVDSIIISPHADLTLQAGASVVFSISLLDQFGEVVDGAEYNLFFDDCVECVGTITDSIMSVVKVG